MEWIFIPVIMFLIFSRRRWDWGGRAPRRHDHESENQRGGEARDRQREEQINLLETRVAELESRLDYAERLLTQRREHEAVSGQ